MFEFGWSRYNCRSTRSCRNVKLLNILALLVHLASSVALFFITAFNWELNLLPVGLSVRTGRPGDANATIIDEPGLQLPVFLLSGIFAFMSFLAHVVYAFKPIKWFDKDQYQYNWMRWVEYFFSSSLMIMILLNMAGAVDLYVMILGFSINATMVLFGDASDRFRVIGETSNAMWMFGYGSFAGVMPWVVLATAFGITSIRFEEALPWFVYTIPIFLFLNFSIFAVVQYYLIASWDDIPKEALKEFTQILKLTNKFTKAELVRVVKHFLISKKLYKLDKDLNKRTEPFKNKLNAIDKYSSWFQENRVHLSEQAEALYMILSMTAKLLLSWQLVGGLLSM